MAGRVVVLFEDQRAGAKAVGLDETLRACLADQLGVTDTRSLRQRVVVHFCKGNGNLLKKCGEIPDLAPSGQRVVAMFDDDQVRRLVGLKESASAGAVVAAIKKRCPEPHRLAVVLLDRNVESVIEAARHCGLPLPEDVWNLALRRKVLNARDRILMNLATGLKAVRDCVRRRVPSFDQLVMTVAGSIQ